jgi:hypothetical protein
MEREKKLAAMILALAAAVKNISIAAESEVAMTTEELELNLKEVNEKISVFGPEEKLSNQEWKQRRLLLREKELLESIKKAREEGRSRQEVKDMTQYLLLKDDTKMHPFFKYLMHLKLKSHLWM